MLLFRMVCLFLLSFSLQARNVVLISGSTGGLGREMVSVFQKSGWSVWAGYRSQVPEAFLDSEDIHPVYLDVSDPTSVSSCVERLIQAEGKIDVLINNAGYGIIASEESVDGKEIKKLFDVNFFGAMELIRTVTPHMKQQNNGHIINISSTSGVRAVPGLGIYAASKFALEGVSEALAVTLSPHNIQVVLVEPGTVENDWAKHCVKDDSELASALSEKLVRLSKGGQKCSEIASLVYSVATTEYPDMRYQTSLHVQNALKDKLSDLTGNAMKEKQTIFFRSLINR